MNTMMTTGTSLKNIVVWLVEDNVDYSETVKRVFWRDYAKIESFSCAEDALKCMHSGVIPDIILMDIHLRGRDEPVAWPGGHTADRLARKRQLAVRDSIPWVRGSLLHRRKGRRYVFGDQVSSRKTVPFQK